MAGLLDGFSEFIKTPEGQGLLAATFGGLAGAQKGAPLNSIGRAGLAGLSGYGGALDRQTQQAEAAQMGKYRDMQQSQMQMQIEAAKKKQEQEAAQAAWRGGLPGVMSQKVYGAGDEGPTMAPDKSALDNYLLHPDSPYADKLMENKLFPKAPETKVVGDSLVQIGANGATPIYTAAAKPDKFDANKPFNIVDGKIVPNPDYQAYELGKAERGAARVNQSVNTGQKGLDNTLKVRGDFRSEPIYKAHGEVQSAHSQITTALKQNSPAGDLAGATKLMKILDPGSVVRESELGMAMAASGLMDRVTNYADMIIKGTKLTPTQRKDFQALSDALLKESQGQYNAKRSEYKGIAERNQLSVEDILGPEPKSMSPKKQVVKTGLYNGRKVNQYSDGTTDYAD